MSDAADAGVAQDVIEGYALSPAQRRWWALLRAGLAHPIQRLVSLPEPPDTKHLQDALERVAERHEILRTRFRRPTGVPEPVQVILEYGACVVHDLGRVESEDALLPAEARIAGQAAGETALRMAVARTGEGRVLLSCTLESGCGDDRSVDELLHQITAVYGDASADAPAEDPLQYVDFAAWLEDERESEEAAPGRAFWRRETAVAVPTPSPRLGRSGRGAVRERRFLPADVRWQAAPETVRALTERAEALGVSPRDLLTAAWLLLLHRLTGSPRPTIGLHVDGRGYQELEGALGPFSGYVPLGEAFGDATPFVDAARRVAYKAELAREHQDLFEWREVEELSWATRRAPVEGEVPYFPVQLEYRSPPTGAVPGGGETERRIADFEPFDLKLVVEMAEGDSPGVRGFEIRYDQSRFNRDEAQLLRGRLDALLGEISNGGEVPCGRIRLLPPSELGRIRGLLWSGPAEASTTVGTRLEDAFLARADSDADAPALDDGERSLSYGELERRSRALAGLLTARGVGAETVVGLHLERSPEVVIAILAVLRAGGAFLVLPPTQPAARLETLAQDAGVALILTRSATAGAPPAGAPVLDLDEVEPDEPAESAPFLPAGPALAYLVYTSGSTGRPKAVAATHQGTVQYLEYLLRTYDLGPRDRVTQIAPLAFDAALREIFGALSSGAAVVLPGAGEELDADRFLRHLGSRVVNRVLSMVPSHLRHLGATAGDSAPAAGVRTLLVSGEPLRGGDVETARRLFGPEVEVVNQYGPTETTLTSSYHRIAGDADPADRIPVGRPIPGMRFHLLDQRLQPLPVGVDGGLYISGPGVARGYHRRPAGTAEAFLPDPFSSELGGRMYRTGDRARLTSDGTLELLGREDRKVKVRGNRVELGGVEAVLAAHPAVSETAVVVRGDGEDEPRLVAFAVARGDGLTIPQLFRHAREQLPAYMVPDAVVLLPELPRTASGKVDLASLPEAEESAAGTDGDGGTPRSEVERLVADVWRQVLRVDQVTTADHFFERGGHSLLATQVIAKLGTIFEIELPLTVIFDHPILAELSREVERRQRELEGVSFPPPAPRPPTARIPASFAQRRLWFLDQLDPGSATYNLFRVLQMDGPLSLPALADALGTMVRRHEALRTRLVERTGEPFQVVEESAPVPLAVIDLSAPDGESGRDEAARLARRVQRIPYALDTLPLWRLVLVRFTPESHLAFYGTHHVISDRWSMAVFVRELSVLYEASLEGVPPGLDPPRLQYPDFALWQHSWLSSGVLEAQLEYWRGKLAGTSPSIGLEKLRRTEPAEPRRVVVRSPMEPATVERLEAVAREEGATLFMVLLAALKLLFHLRTGREDLALGTDVANRNHPGTDTLLGFFINLLVLRTDLSGLPTFRELLSRVRKTCLEAYVHQDLPYDRLVEDLRSPRGTDSELFELLVVFQNVPRERLALRDLEISGLPTEPGAPRFDLVANFEVEEDTVNAIWSFDAGRLDEDGVRRLVEQSTAVFSQVAADPGRRLHRYELARRAEEEEDEMQDTGKKSTRFSKFKKVKPQVIDIPQGDLVRFEAPDPAVGLPLLAYPAVDDVDLAIWAAENRRSVEEKLSRHGAVLFRGFELTGAEDFRRVASAVCPDLFGDYGDLPREGVASNVYTSTPYPADKTILFHNESSHMHWWPLRQFFFCVQASETGGETPISDCRKICDVLPREVFEEFRSKGIEYIRNFSEKLDVDWCDFFGTEDKEEVEAFCREAAFELEWLPDDGLRVRQRGPAVVEHPQTGEVSFFNQVQIFHPSSLDPETRDSLYKLFGEKRLPRNARFGDGSPISDDVMAEVDRAYWSTCAQAPWQEGDFLALDNMLVAHARKPFTGERKILVAMGDMFRRDDLPAQ